MENQKFGTLDVELIDIDKLRKLSKEEIEAMWKDVAGIQWENNKTKEL